MSNKKQLPANLSSLGILGDLAHWNIKHDLQSACKSLHTLCFAPALTGTDWTAISVADLVNAWVASENGRVTPVVKPFSTVIDSE